MQNAGLIRSQDFDTVFMGTSLAIHFRQSDIDRLLGGRSLKLAMTGSNSHEQSFVLAAAMERHPKRVIWQMDDWIFRDAPEIDPRHLSSGRSLPAQCQGHRELSVQRRHGARIALDTGALDPAVRAVVARLTTGVMFKFPISRVDDINMLRPDFDVAGFYNAQAATANVHRASPTPSAAPTSRKAMITTRW